MDKKITIDDLKSNNLKLLVYKLNEEKIMNYELFHSEQYNNDFLEIIDEKEHYNGNIFIDDDITSMELSFGMAAQQFGMEEDREASINRILLLIKAILKKEIISFQALGSKQGQGSGFYLNDEKKLKDSLEHIYEDGLIYIYAWGEQKAKKIS